MRYVPRPCASWVGSFYKNAAWWPLPNPATRPRHPCACPEAAYVAHTHRKTRLHLVASAHQVLVFGATFPDRHQAPPRLCASFACVFLGSCLMVPSNHICRPCLGSLTRGQDVACQSNVFRTGRPNQEPVGVIFFTMVDSQLTPPIDPIFGHYIT